MIHFTTIRYKNFLSTGSQFTEIQLDRSPSTLITGVNGSGKSTILCALCFVLYGKPFRNINKPQLVNSVNKKDCLVEVEFKIGDKQYKIVRGIKPNKFEIYLNGEMINQDSAVRDYQAYLEDHVLKMNYKSFTQIVILGSTSFTPFMQLAAGHRREVIENLLDINIFSMMNETLKEKIKDTKDLLLHAEAEVTLARQKVELQKKYIDNLESDNQKKLDDLQSSMKKTQDEVDRLKSLSETLLQESAALQSTIADAKSIRNKLNDLRVSERTNSNLIQTLNKSLSFYADTQVCPTCSQCLEEEHKEQNTKELQSQIDSINEELKNIRSSITECTSRISEIESIEAIIKEKTSELNVTDSRIDAGNSYYKKLEKEFTESQICVNITDEKMKLKELATDALQSTQTRSDLKEAKQYYDICATLLKDGGIKTRIIKQFLPIINKLVNKYLAAFDFFVSFELDENFNEVIRSRHRDDFSYANFSEGEKSKIDLALLLTWRNIAKMKNSASSNLLICDEILDSTLDNTSTENLLNIFGTMTDTNIFVISHSPDQYFDKFRSAVKFEKVGNYSRIAQ